MIDICIEDDLKSLPERFCYLHREKKIVEMPFIVSGHLIIINFRG
jgi:hypothetical protein